MAGIPVPDFSSLAQQQGNINKDAAWMQTVANRPDQYNAWGNNDVHQLPDGTWTQTSSLSGQGQDIFNTASAGQRNLAGQLGQTSGAVQSVIDANMALQSPMLQQARDKEQQRLAAMGITMGSNAYNDTQRNLANSESDAYQKAILAGTQEYGNVYNRALQGTAGLSNLKDSLDPTKHNTTLPAATGYTPANMYQAGMDTYNAGLAQQNADTAAQAAKTSGYMNLAGNVLGSNGFWNAAGPAIASGAGKLWDWIVS